MSPIARSRFFTISCTRDFAAGGKCFATYFRPSASPSSWSVDSTQRFQRGFISFAPPRYCSSKANRSCTKGAERWGAADRTRCQRR